MTSMASETETEPKPGTRTRLLDVAETMFAANGFASTSVREITDAAGTNLGAINYHFQSKENLYAEVFRRRIARVHEQFLAALRDSEAATGGDLDGTLSALARAFMSPHTEPENSRRFLDLCTREMIEARLPAGLFLREFVTPLIEMIMSPIRRARSDLDENATRSCAHSFLAQLLHIVKGARAAAGTDIAIAPVGEQLAHVVRFTAAAVRHI